MTLKPLYFRRENTPKSLHLSPRWTEKEKQYGFAYKQSGTREAVKGKIGALENVT